MISGASEGHSLLIPPGKSGKDPHQELDKNGDHRQYEQYCNKQLIPESISAEQAFVIILLNIIILVHGDQSVQEFLPCITSCKQCPYHK